MFCHSEHQRLPSARSVPCASPARSYCSRTTTTSTGRSTATSTLRRHIRTERRCAGVAAIVAPGARPSRRMHASRRCRQRHAERRSQAPRGPHRRAQARPPALESGRGRLGHAAGGLTRSLLRDTGRVTSDASTPPDLVAFARRQLDAVNRRDLDALMAAVAPDAAYDTSPSGMGVYEGHEAIRAFLKGYWDCFEELRFELEEARPRQRHHVSRQPTGRPSTLAAPRTSRPSKPM